MNKEAGAPGVTFPADMTLYVPSRGRANVKLQYTIAQLSKEARGRTFQVIRADEGREYDKIRQSLGVHQMYRPDSCQNLSQTLNWLIHEVDTTRYIVLMDDDIRFSVRDRPEAHNLAKATVTDMDVIFQRVRALLEKYPLVGLSNRMGNQGFFPGIVKLGGRQMQFHAIDTLFFREEHIHPSDVTVKSDFHMTLSVLEKGSTNAVLVDAAVDQAKGSNAPGGVSMYRDIATINAGAARLKALHPDFVSIVKKTTEWKGVGNVERDEVRIDWRRASAFSAKIASMKAAEK